MTTGPERIRAAIERDRGGNAPTDRIRVCGPECRGEVPEAPVSAPQSIGRRRKMSDALLEPLVCPGCIRFKFSPIHLFDRLLGLCDGRNCW